MQVKMILNGCAKEKGQPKVAVGCPLNASVEILADRRSLLIIREMMLRNFRTCKEFLESYKGIATNIPAGHEDTGNQTLVQQIQKNKEQFLRSVRKRLGRKYKPLKS
jgi:hypothetical protein